MTDKHAGITISVVVLLVLGIGFTVHAHKLQSREPAALAGAVCGASGAAEGLALESASAYALDIETGDVLFERHATRQAPLASLTKLMTIVIAAETLDTDGIITIPAPALTPEGDAGLLAGEVWEVKDLIDFTLITSANDGAHALALAGARARHEPWEDFVDSMNARARALGLSQTYFLNDTGLDVSTTTSGAYGSARDVAMLLSYIYSNAPSTFSASSMKEKRFVSISGFMHHAEHTSTLPGTLPGEVVAKTGFTDLSGGNLALIAEPLIGHPVAIVVLGSSRVGRDRDGMLIYEYAKSALKRKLLCGN